MKLIVGLGNPGLIYTGTRHNIGFTVVKSLARSLKVVLKRDSSVFSLVAKAEYAGEALVLALPQTFMNLSGMAVSALLKKFKIASSRDILVVCDDMDLDLGRIRIRPQGSSAGHRGVSSIIEKIGTPEFNRLRFGIGRPGPGKDAAHYVLEGFGRREKAAVEEAMENAVRCCLSWAEQGITAAMDGFNTLNKSKQKEGGE